jgi:hypothetical protein
MKSVLTILLAISVEAIKIAPPSRPLINFLH